MKYVRLFLLCLLLGGGLVRGQFDSLLTLHVARFDSAGFVYFHPNGLGPGDPFRLYRLASGDLDNDFVLRKTWPDMSLDLVHYRYQQTYKGLRVEAAEVSEHAEDGQLIFANGKVVADLNASPVPELGEAEALEGLLLSLPDHVFAWMDADMEHQAQLDLGDSLASFYPVGELLWALDDYRDLRYLIPASRYRLAWRFEVLSLVPDFHKAFFVDAHTGEVFREEELRWHNGPASIYYHGTQTIDTRWTGSVGKHILHATDFGRDVHTKNYARLPWGLIGEINDADDVWTANTQDETSPHWFASQSWDYFQTTFGRDGMDGNGGQVRVYVDRDSAKYTFFEIKAGKPYISFWETHGRAIDIVGHEFVHGVTLNEVGFLQEYESGALCESFSDIFGVLIEHYTQGTASDWTIGENTGLAAEIRSLAAPKSAGLHADTLNDCAWVSGQPDTYEGEFWYIGSRCDKGGIHINSGVQNHWFYLLSEGGSGINDHNESYSISGIGSAKAALICYRSIVNNLQSGAQYADARASSITEAELLFGQCSNEVIQVTNAWHAVGVGATTICPITYLEDGSKEIEMPQVFPNPSNDVFHLLFSKARKREIQVFSARGELLLRKDFTQIDPVLDLGHLPQGIYLLQIQEKDRRGMLKLVRQ